MSTTTQYIDDDSVVFPSNHRPFRFTTTDSLNLDDVSIISILIEWKHGIYGTDESARFTVVSTAHAEDVLIHQDGSLETMSVGGPGGTTSELHNAIARHIGATV